MIVDRNQTMCLDIAGWGGGPNAVWRFDADTGRESVIPWPRGFNLFPASDGAHVMMQEYPSSGSGTFSIRRIGDVEVDLAFAVHEKGRWQFEGDESLWGLFPSYALGWNRELGRSVLLHLDQADPEPDPLGWFSDEDYDLGYQSLLGVTELPGEKFVIVTIQRDSEPILYDPLARKVIGKLPLAGRGGNPLLHVCRHAPEIWTVDGDTVLRIDRRTLEIVDRIQLENEGEGRRGLVGDVWLPFDEDICVVARPFSGDVVIIRRDTSTIEEIVPLEDQPLDAVALKDGTVLAREWQSRRLLTGRWRGAAESDAY